MKAKDISGRIDVLLDEDQKRVPAEDEIHSVWDNGGRTMDRYTVVLKKANKSDRYHDSLGMSGDPSSPAGFSQWGDALPGKHLGKKIGFTNLPAHIQAHVKMRLGESLTEKKEHKLIIKSLHDAHAVCSCGGWHYSFTGPETRKEIEKEYQKHSKGLDEDLVDDIMDYEGGEMKPRRMVDFFGGLVKSGQAWSLQGHYGRTAKGLIDAGYLHPKTGKVLKYPDDDEE